MVNKMSSKCPLKQVSEAMAQLVPNVIRGTQFDFFLKRHVTQTQFLMLMTIRACPGCTMGLVAKNLHVSMPTATGVVDRLVKSGYIRRIASSEDRRKVTVELTPKSHLFIRQFQDVVRHRWEEVLRSLDSNALEAFYNVITKLNIQLESRP